MRKILSALLVASTVVLSVNAQKQGNFSYFLPKTAVRMSLLIEKKTFTPGQLAGYSDMYFKTSAPTEPSVTYRIVGTSFSSVGLPDDKKKYELFIDKKHSIVSVECDRNGVLKAINDKAADSPVPTPFKPSPKVAQPDPHDYMSQDILSSGNLPKMARMVAQEIYDIRDSRNQLSRGEADFMPKDGEQLKIMLDNLNTQESALLKMFEGSTVTDTTETVLTFVPEKGISKQVLFRFSRHFGLVGSDDLSGDPYYLLTEDLNVMPELPALPEEAKKKDDMVIGVCLPGKIRLTVSDGQKPTAHYETYAAQFGRTELLSGSLFGKKMTSHIIVDPVAGTVLKLRTEPLE